MNRPRRHRFDGRVYEETHTYRIPREGEVFLSSVMPGHIYRCSSVSSVVHHPEDGQVRQILREVKTFARPVAGERPWTTLTIELVDEGQLDKAKAERDAALERVAELEGTDDYAIKLAMQVGIDYGRAEAATLSAWLVPLHTFAPWSDPPFIDGLREWAGKRGAELKEVSYQGGQWTYVLDGPAPGGSL